MINIMAVSILITGCSEINNEGVGTLTGGVVGGLLGSQFGGGAGKVAAAAGGALIGAYLGGRIGNTMDRLDQMKMQNALETASTGNKANWHNPDSGNTYTMIPTKTYYPQQNRPCRDYQLHAVIDGKNENITGRACRQANGSWKVAN